MTALLVFDPTTHHPCREELPDEPQQNSVWRCSCGRFWAYIMGFSGTLTWRNLTEEDAVEHVRTYLRSSQEAKRVILEAIMGGDELAARR